MITRSHEQNFQLQRELSARRFRNGGKSDRLARLKPLRTQYSEHPEVMSGTELVKATLYTAYCRIRDLLSGL